MSLKASTHKSASQNTAGEDNSAPERGIFITPSLDAPESASGYGVTLDATELAAILEKEQAHFRGLGYEAPTKLAFNVIVQELVWKAEREGLNVEDIADPDPRVFER